MNLKECKNNIYALISVKFQRDDICFTFLKVLITLLLQQFNSEKPTLLIFSKSETKILEETNKTKLKINLHKLIELVLNHYTINKSDIDIIYQELSKYFHLKNQKGKNYLNLTKEISNNYLQLFKVRLLTYSNNR